MLGDAAARRLPVRRAASTSRARARSLGRSYAPGGRGAGARGARRSRRRVRATARHLATKLARHFAGDDPPPAMVERLTQAFSQAAATCRRVYRAIDRLARGVEPRSRPSSRRPGTGRSPALRAVGRAACRGAAGGRPAEPARPAGLAAGLARRLRRYRRELGRARRADAPGRGGASASPRSAGGRSTPARSRRALLPGALSEATAQRDRPRRKPGGRASRCCSSRPNS